MTKSRKGGAGGKRKEYSAPALEKGLDIIEALANVTCPPEIGPDLK